MLPKNVNTSHQHYPTKITEFNKMSIDKRFDDVLMTMAGQAGSLEVLLRIFFSFLHRNTDFYVTYDASKVKATMGFPPGKAEKLLLSSFRSFPHKSYTNPGSSSSSAGKNSMKVESIYKDKPKKAQEASSKPLPDSTHKSTATSSPDRASSTSANSPTSKCITSTGAPSDSAGENKRSATNTTPSATSAVASTASPAESETCVERMRIRYTDDGKQIPIGNGGVTPRYYWTQNVTETTVYVDVPEGTRSKDVDCKIGPRRLRLAVRGAGAHAGLSSDGDVIIDGEMPSVVSKEDSMWSLSDGMSVVISLEKTKRSWWQSVVEGDPEIDTTQVRRVWQDRMAKLVALKNNPD